MKSNTRKRLALIRNILSQKERKIFSESIEKNLINLAEYQNARAVLLYCSFGSEVETRSLIQKCLNDKKTTLLPSCLPNKRTMRALKINNFEKDTEIGHLKIIEPKKSCEEVYKSNIDLVVVPGVGFGEAGERIGYGKGFYDRFLKGCTGTYVGICFEKQITDKIILEEHDVKMHKIVTEKRVIDCQT